MKVTIEKSLTTLDEKTNINLLNKFQKHNVSEQIPIDLNNYVLWTINDFLTESECSEIIASSNTFGFKKLEGYDKNFRDNERILAFDSNGQLLDTINDRLGNVLKVMSEEKVKPYGFYADQYIWSDIMV